MIKSLYLLSIIFLLVCNTSPKESHSVKDESTLVEPKTERWQPTDYRNENWHPKDGKYFFSEQWTWHYINETAPENDPYQEGDFSVLVDLSTGTMLLSMVESHYQDEMTEWIIINPEGTYLDGLSTQASYLCKNKR